MENITVENKNRKKAGRNEISYITWMYLKSYGMNLSRKNEIIPVINAVLFSINELLKNDFEISLNGFGNFYIQDLKSRNVKLNGVEYKTKAKRRVWFKYTNKVFE